MVRVRPIRGLRYGENIVDKNLVVAPPYDVISREDQIRLHARHPKNIVWVDYGMERAGRGEEKYMRANHLLEDFISDGTLVRDDVPALYCYEQEFELEGKGTFVRSGFICALWLEKFGEGDVYPHERTLRSPKIDRLNLMKHTNTATSPIFGIYDDEEGGVNELIRPAISGRDPDIAVVDDLGVSHRMWVVTDRNLITRVGEMLAEKKVFIADGHHRYETALAYRDWMRESAGDEPDSSWNYVMIFLSGSGDGGLVILPTHRGVYGIGEDRIDSLVTKLGTYFAVEQSDGGIEDLMGNVSLVEEGQHRIGMIDSKGRSYVLKMEGEDLIEKGTLSLLPPVLRDLDIALLHGIVFEKILEITPEEITSGNKVAFYKDMNKGLADLKSGAIQLFFYLNPVTMKQFIDVSERGIILPQKTTYFFPKILTGLVLFPLGEKDRVG